MNVLKFLMSLYFNTFHIFGFRVYSAICMAVTNFMKEKTVYDTEKELYVGFCDVPAKHK